MLEEVDIRPYQQIEEIHTDKLCEILFTWSNT